MTNLALMRGLGILFVCACFMAYLMFFISPAFADTNCQLLYGGGQNCTVSQISIEKTIVNPDTNTDFHDLTESEHVFHGDNTVIFHIHVKNIGNNIISSSTIMDNFPLYLNFSSGPGSFNSSTQELIFNVGPLSPEQTQTFTVVGRIVPDSGLPNIQNNCVNNIVMVTTVDNQTAQDSSEFCVSPGGTPVLTPTPTTTQAVLGAKAPTSSPATGPSMLLFLLPGVGLTGFVIKKIAEKKNI